MTRAAWVLNLDADVELARPAGYAPTKAVIAAMAPHAERFARSLVTADDIVVDDASPHGIARGFVGRAFCPTPRALAILRRAGAEPEAHPPLEVLREVNGRAFSAALGQILPGAVFVRDLESALAVLGRAPELGTRWRVKRAFGMAGRGQRVLTPGAPSADDRAFLSGGIADGLQIEPEIAIDRELALHGLLAADGAAHFGRIVEQRCDERGRWLSSELLGDGLAKADAATLVSEGERVAIALHSAGYFGPFGIDAFVYGSTLNPRSEINARYGMGFAVGMGLTTSAVTR